MYSAGIYKEDFLSIKKIIKPYSKKIEKLLEKCNTALLGYKRECEGYSVHETIGTLAFSLMRLSGELDEFLQKPMEFPGRKDVLDFYFQIRNFLNIYELVDEHYVIYSEIADDGRFMLRLMCVDPSQNVQRCLDKGKATIFFSATFLPIDYYKKLLSTKKDNYAIYAQSTFINSAVLVVSGGFQDAYTYFTRDKVFSNAQTGNVVLMSQNFMTGNIVGGIKYLFPFLAFGLGVFVTEQINAKYKMSKKIHWRQLVLLIEIAILTIVGFMPESFNMAATVMVSFSCSMQVQAFRKVNGFAYASTMCIGNLRSGTDALSVYVRERKREQLVKAFHYFGIIFFFALGAGIGGNLSVSWGVHTIWVSSVILFISMGLMWYEKYRK